MNAMVGYVDGHESKVGSTCMYVFIHALTHTSPKENINEYQ
jgi:hypothetical protein